MSHLAEELWEEDFSDGDRNPRHKKSSCSDMVRGEHADFSLLNEAQGSKACSPRNRLPRLTPNKSPSERMYTKDEVLAILKESKLRGSNEREEGWTMVNSIASIKKATAEAREFMGVSKKKRKMHCRECNGTNHISADCPIGITCLYCRKKGHRIAKCPRNQPKVRGDSGKRAVGDEEAFEEKPIWGTKSTNYLYSPF